MSVTTYGSSSIVVPNLTASNTYESCDLISQAASLIPSSSNAAVILQWMNKVLKTPDTPFWSNLTMYTFSTAPPGYNGNCLLPDGRVFMSNGNTSGGPAVFNPFTNTFTTSLNGVIGSIPVWGACLMPDGRVFQTGWTQPVPWIFNPVTNTQTSLAAIPTGGGFDVLGCCLTPSGNVFMTPYGSNYWTLYNPKTNSYFTGQATATAGANYIFPVLHPNGNIYCSPGFSSSVGIFNESTMTFTSVTGAQYSCWSGTVLLDGRILFFPNGAANVELFNPVTNTRTSGAAATGYTGGHLLPGGNVIMCGGTKWAIYNPVTNTIVNSGTNTTNLFYPRLMGNGNITFAPDGAVYVMSQSPPVPMELLLHPIFNHD